MQSIIVKVFLCLHLLYDRYLHVSREKHLTPSVKEGVDTLLMYLYRALNRVEDMERLATSENCCVVVCAILLLPFAFVAF